jgi:hypothetical protein
LVALAVVYGLPYILGGDKPRSREELAEAALNASTPQEQESAAVDLAALGKDAEPQLARVFKESNVPEVKAAVIQGLAAIWSYDNMPALLDALDDDSALVRARAGRAVQNMMSVEYHFRAQASAAERKPVVKAIRDRWEVFRKSKQLEKWKQRLQDKGDHS